MESLNANLKYKVWLSDAKALNLHPGDKGKFLDKMTFVVAKSLPTYGEGQYLISRPFQFLLGFANAAHEGHFLPKRTCFYRAFWP